MKPYIYIAAPFFNDLESNTVTQVEGLLASKRLDHFSPRRDGGNKGRQNNVTGAAKQIFDANIEGMDKCNILIACLDRPQPDGQGIFLCQENKGQYIGFKGPFEQTDLGTAWEMGYVFSRNKAHRDVIDTLAPPAVLIAGFTKHQRGGDRKVNVMLSKCCDNVIHGMNELMGFMNACADGVTSARSYLVEDLPKTEYAGI